MNNEQLIEQLQAHWHDILQLLGENPDREGLKQTPQRVAKCMLKLMEGYTQDPIQILKSATFEESYSQPVLVKDIEFYSMCEHHVLPFFGKVHVAYIPNGRIVGLSKIPRIIDIFARRLQVQERMTREICECINEALAPKGVMVVIEAQHLCMQMRGVEKQGSKTVTSDYSGDFKDPALRAEIYNQMMSENCK